MIPTPKITQALRWPAALLASLALSLVSFATTPVALDQQHPGVRAVMAAQAEVTPGLMNIAGILGTAVGLDPTDQLVLVD
jgi:hypothetical protein